MSYRNASYAAPEPVVDLAPHLAKLLAYEDISLDLSEDEEQRLIDYVRNCLRLSHSRISNRYDAWAEADKAHDVYVEPSATKFSSKVVMPDTRAIADTVLTYQMAALAGRSPMFQLEGQNRKSRRAALIMERLLHSHLRRNAGEAHIAQLLLDSIRYGFAPTKITWDPNTRTNHIHNFDPRSVFPDPRVSWGDWQRMAFCVFVDRVSTTALLATNLYPKLHIYPALANDRWSMPHAGWEAHRWHRERGAGLSIDPTDPTQPDTSAFTVGPARILDECWLVLSGHEINVPSISQLYLVVTVLDEGCVIRCQLSPHGRQFPLVIGGLFHDAHKTYAQSIYDLLLPLHNVTNWLLRSRIDNVQASLSNLIFADPNQIAISDLIDRNPWGIVRTLAGSKPGDGVFVAQVPDVTRSHWSDIAAISDLKQRVSAASDAQQGMPTSDGVRTATEIQRLTQLGSQRLGVIARILSATTMRPMVHMMVSNIQDALTFDGSMRVAPSQANGELTPLIQDGYLDFTIADLQGDLDYLVVDGTLPIEPTRNAETWLSILQVMSQTGLQLEFRMDRIAEEAIRAMGLSDLDAFRISREQAQQGPSPSQQLSILEKMRGASVQPADQVLSQAQRGNLVPLQRGAA